MLPLIELAGKGYRKKAAEGDMKIRGIVWEGHERNEKEIFTLNSPL